MQSNLFFLITLGSDATGARMATFYCSICLIASVAAASAYSGTVPCDLNISFSTFFSDAYNIRPSKHETMHINTKHAAELCMN
jgi:hypothetical protein